MDTERAKQATTASGFGVLLAVATGATAIGVGIVGLLGAALAWFGYRRKRDENDN